MFKSPYFIALIAIFLIVGLFFLPKVVVKDDAQLPEETHTADDGHDHSADANIAPSTAVDSTEISISDQENIKFLRENIFNSVDIEKSVKFADSLATVFKGFDRLDSAAKYVEHVATLKPGQENWLRAADSYYDAFSFAVDEGRLQYLGEKAREYYIKALAENPGLLEAKSKLAMTYISTANPMKGIALLQEVLEEDPDHEQATFNLGILSIQSGQYDRAVERFERLATLYPENLQAQFYLGVSYLETGKRAKARKQFEKVKELDADPAVQAAVDGYLEEL